MRGLHPILDRPRPVEDPLMRVPLRFPFEYPLMRPDAGSLLGSLHLSLVQKFIGYLPLNQLLEDIGPGFGALALLVLEIGLLGD